MLRRSLSRVTAALTVGVLILLMAGCSHTPKYKFTFTNGCTFAIFVSMLTQGQGHTATSPMEIEPGDRRNVVVFSTDPGARATLIVEAVSGDPDNLNTRDFPVSTGDVDHAPDPSKPLASVIDVELCEGLEPEAGGQA